MFIEVLVKLLADFISYIWSNKQWLHCRYWIDTGKKYDASEYIKEWYKGLVSFLGIKQSTSVFFAKICCKFIAFLRFFCRKNTENDYFDQRLEYAALKRWSKYTTLYDNNFWTDSFTYLTLLSTLFGFVQTLHFLGTSRTQNRKSKKRGMGWLEIN